MNNYLDIKEKNPSFPFIVRECLNAQPTVMARYDFGVEKRIYVPNLDEKDEETQLFYNSPVPSLVFLEICNKVY